MSKYGVISGPYFPVFGSVFNPNAEKYGPEMTPYLDTFHAVLWSRFSLTCSYYLFHHWTWCVYYTLNLKFFIFHSTFFPATVKISRPGLSHPHFSIICWDIFRDSPIMVMYKNLNLSNNNNKGDMSLCLCANEKNISNEFLICTKHKNP